REIKLKHRIPVKKTANYWKGLEEGRVFKTVCRNCEKSYYPPRADCICGNQTEWVEIKEKGFVECFTVVHSIPACFEWSKPYRIVIARFGDVCVMGWSEEDLRVGDEVFISTAKDESGIWKIWFRR
ncbi:MAG: zinc ribbon domain-containing protein, partial [Archaeoglobaceae archaeon]